MALTAIVAGALLFTLLASVAALLATCLKTAAPDEALVLTTPAGRRVAAGSVVVLPVVHSLERVSLRTHAVRLERTADAPLRTRDDHAVELVATFHVRVNRADDDVLRALQTMGPGTSDGEAVHARFAPRLTEALEAVARDEDALTIDRERERFKDSVIARAGRDLDGFVLDGLAVTGVRVLPVSPYRG